MCASGFRIVDHTADVGIEAWGADLGEVLARAVEGLFRVIGAPAAGASLPPWELQAEGVDREDLLVRVLTEALAAFELEGRHVASASTVRCDDARATLRCEGVLVDRDAEPRLQEVKAVTYHGLRIEEGSDGLRARVVLDL